MRSTPGNEEVPSYAAHFTSSRKGAHTARRHAAAWLAAHGCPDTTGTIALVIAELTANAIHHGHVPGHDFALHLTLNPKAAPVRIEVADAATTKHPPKSAHPATPDAESGRGLLLVNALAHRWGTSPRDHVGKVVWAEMTTGE
ncbi:ATP-binding protein [Streptomyces sp. AM 3-1-1]|uniref:ATP-binding protein n=1 Tax=Streptomyces sp. AM 3-1-1 TaxID=3028711 RepID=UPI0023B88D45|nr:ATP-binding protein [Streptomyces sp. AM 3-1-1]WEH28884.1 ATP-binding protein [Streptomyces sp. AM 3-1-1]